MVCRLTVKVNRDRQKYASYPFDRAIGPPYPFAITSILLPIIHIQISVAARNMR
jgi:hypothetical protein